MGRRPLLEGERAERAEDLFSRSHEAPQLAARAQDRGPRDRLESPRIRSLQNEDAVPVVSGDAVPLSPLDRRDVGPLQGLTLVDEAGGARVGQKKHRARLVRSQKVAEGILVPEGQGLQLDGHRSRPRRAAPMTTTATAAFARQR